MSKRVFHNPNYTPTATADTTAVPNGYQAIKGGASTAIIQVLDIAISGLATTSAPTLMQWARVSTLETSATTLAAPASDGFMNPVSLAITSGPTCFIAATTGPQRSATTTDAKLELNINAFGGKERWQAAPGEEWWIVGNTAPAGESILSAFTGGTVGALSSHIIYEPA